MPRTFSVPATGVSSATATVMDGRLLTNLMATGVPFATLTPSKTTPKDPSPVVTVSIAHCAM